jgi:hypothetical protein
MTHISERLVKENRNQQVSFPAAKPNIKTHAPSD